MDIKYNILRCAQKEGPMPIHSASVIIGANGQEIRQHGTPEFPCGCYTLPQEIQVPWHWHDEFSTLVFHGRLVYGTTDSVFYQKYISQLLTPEAPQVLVLRKNVPWHTDILERTKKASRLCQNKPEGYEFAVRNLLSELLFDLYCYSNAPSNESQTANTSDHERIKRMLLYLQENYAHPVTVAKLAAHANICERECLRCFKKMLRMSPIQYLIRYRIARASRMLREEKLSVLEISSRCGFESPSYFTKTFRQIVGCTPTQYRNAPHKS